jgi:glutamate-1-semialdehyde aminotransferase
MSVDRASLEAMVRAAVEAQLGKLWHVSNHYYNEPSVALAERLVRDGHAQRVFFCNSGTEANEGAIKLVRRWHHDKGTGRFEILCAQDSFHGRTMATLSATAARAAEGSLAISCGDRIIDDALSAGRSILFGISTRIVEFSTVPKIAIPNEPPSERKNITVAVVTPKSWYSTAF